MDLDLWDCFGIKNLSLITEEIRYKMVADAMMLCTLLSMDTRFRYSRPSVAQTLMVPLPQLFRKKLLLQSSAKNPIAADIIVFGISSGEFLLYIDNGMLQVLIRIASMKRF